MKYFILFFTPLFFSNHIVAQQSSSIIAAKSPSELYIGGVLKIDEINDSEHATINVIDDSITISFQDIATKSTTFQTGKENMYQSLHQALSSATGPIFKANSSFSYSLQTISEYKDVEPYLGQTIDLRDWFGIVPSTRRPKTVMALDINRVAFTLHVDLPANGKFNTDPNGLAGHNVEDLVYVNSLSFGRRVLVLIESNMETGIVNRAIKNIMEGDTSDGDELVLANCTFRAVTFGNEEVIFDPSSPFSQVLNYINGEFTIENYGLPISFSGAYLQNNSVFNNNY